jgi:ketosteroid isomerase-like protein
MLGSHSDGGAQPPAHLSPHRTTRFEVLHQAASADLAFWAGFQIATVQIGDAPKPTAMKIRVTEVFRKIDGAWRLVHRHADLGRTAE